MHINLNFAQLELVFIASLLAASGVRVCVGVRALCYYKTYTIQLIKCLIAYMF